jgi:hypothetical protein
VVHTTSQHRNDWMVGKVRLTTAYHENCYVRTGNIDLWPVPDVHQRSHRTHITSRRRFYAPTHRGSNHLRPGWGRPRARTVLVTMATKLTTYVDPTRNFVSWRCYKRCGNQKIVQNRHRRSRTKHPDSPRPCRGTQCTIPIHQRALFVSKVKKNKNNRIRIG